MRDNLENELELFNFKNTSDAKKKLSLPEIALTLVNLLIFIFYCYSLMMPLQNPSCEVLNETPTSTDYYCVQPVRFKVEKNSLSDEKIKLPVSENNAPFSVPPTVFNEKNLPDNFDVPPVTLPKGTLIKENSMNFKNLKAN